MTDAFFAVQQAIYNTLAASSEMQAQLGNPPCVYNHVPPNPLYPYVAFGAIAAKPFDDIDRTGFTQTVTLDIWSRYRGTKEVKDIAQAIYDTLHRATLTVSGEVFISCEFVSADITVEGDGLTYHGETRYSVVTQSS